MKHYLTLVTILFLTIHASAQSDSIFTNLTSYKADICTHIYDWEGMEIYEYLTVESDSLMSDTLSVSNQYATDFASLWIDGRKTWLRIDSSKASVMDFLYFYHYSSYPDDYPLDEFFLLYDFDVLDTVSEGETLVFEDSPINYPINISGIDTVQVNGVEKRRYEIVTEVDYRDYLIEGIGGLHAFTTLLRQGLFGACNCGYEATYMSETDTLILSDTMVFGNDPWYYFCLTASLPKYENSKPIKVYPNPNKGSFIVSYQEGSRIKDVEVIGVDGKILACDLEKLNDSESRITVKQNVSGMYWIKLITENGDFYLSKFVIE